MLQTIMAYMTCMEMCMSGVGTGTIQITTTVFKRVRNSKLSMPKTQQAHLRGLTACFAAGTGVTTGRAFVLRVGVAPVRMSGTTILAFGWCVPSFQAHVRQGK
jgi:hypothetical protein